MFTLTGWHCKNWEELIECQWLATSWSLLNTETLGQHYLQNPFRLRLKWTFSKGILILRQKSLFSLFWPDPHWRLFWPPRPPAWWRASVWSPLMTFDEWWSPLMTSGSGVGEGAGPAWRVASVCCSEGCHPWTRNLSPCKMIKSSSFMRYFSSDLSLSHLTVSPLLMLRWPGPRGVTCMLWLRDILLNIFSNIALDLFAFMIISGGSLQF